MVILVFQVLKTLMVDGILYFLGGLVFWWSRSGLYATAVSSESVYSWCDPETWPEYWLVLWDNCFPGVDDPSSLW